MLQSPVPFITAVGVSAVIAVISWRMRSLSVGGAVTALLIGTASLSVSYGTGVYVIVWFALATVLSRIGKAQKARRTSEIVEKSSQRDAGQVLANGGVFTAFVLTYLTSHPGCNLFGSCNRILVAAAASLAAAGADTWATEVGTLFGGTPWSVRTASRVPTGTSGAVTVPGTLAMVVGAVTLALLATVFGVVNGNRSVVAVAAGGIAGALTDTLLGAWIQERRWCPRCTIETEQRVHRCGTLTIHHRGMSGLDNDIVNGLCTIVGAAAALLIVLT